MRGVVVVVVVVVVGGCTEYGLEGKPDAPTLVDSAAPDPQTTPPPAPTTPPPPASCEGVELPTFGWVGSAPFGGPDDPVDGAGLPFWDPAADLSGWAAVAAPDLAIPIGLDRAYAARFTLDEVPYDLSLNLQSDDGLWVWVNGVPIGQWGGMWQMEGCVNEHAHCLVTTNVAPVSVTSLLVVGENVIAARVSNPVLNAYFDILPQCIEP